MPRYAVADGKTRRAGLETRNTSAETEVPRMTFSSIAAVATGAAFGALLRWCLAILLNPLHPRIAVGTLAANLIGGFLIGLLVFQLDRHPDWSPLVRLAVVTGLLGSLTTFSTFSYETVWLLSQRHYAWALTEIVLHVAGSLLATSAGILAARALL